jgi:small subunit ribosomal protein S1
MSIKNFEINWEEDDTALSNVAPLSQEFASLLASDVPTSDSFSRGELVKGVIASTGSGDLVVDLGGKTSAILLRDSLDDSTPFSLGQEVSAYVVGFTDGSILLSKTMTSKMKGSEALEQAYTSKLSVKGKVLKANKGGFEIQIGSKVAFCPISQIDSKFVSQTEDYVGKEFEFLITQYSPRNIVVSRQALLRLREKELIPALVEQIKTDPFVNGVVTDLKDFGAIVDLGGPQGMIHISEMAFGRLNHPSEAVKVGDKVRVKVLAIEEGDKPRISLSLKQAGTDPWTEVETHLKPDESYPGKVTRLADFGAFVEILPGLEGLIHISEMSWKRVSHPKEILSVGSEITVRVTSIDGANRRLSLTLKDAESDPWRDAANLYKVGSTHEGKVQSLKSNGAFIELGEALVGFIPLSQLKAAYGESYRKHASPPRGLQVEVSFLDVDSRKIALKIPGVGESESSDADYKDYISMEKAKPEVIKATGSFGDLLKQASVKKGK